MKPLSKFAVAICVTTLSLAHSAPLEEAQQLPSGPLLRPVPDFSQWTVVYRDASSGQTGQEQGQETETQEGGKDPGAKKLAPKAVVGQRTGDIRHIVITYGNGNKMEVWKKGGVQVVTCTGWDSAVVTAAAEDDLYGDFGWISADNFEGIKKVGGRDCMVFRDSILPPGTPKSLTPALLINLPEGYKPQVDTAPAPETLKIKAVACIEVERRVPVILQLGDEVTTYKFAPIDPPAPLNLPVEVNTEMAAHDQQTRAAFRKPVSP